MLTSFLGQKEHFPESNWSERRIEKVKVTAAVSKLRKRASTYARLCSRFEENQTRMSLGKMAINLVDRHLYYDKRSDVRDMPVDKPRESRSCQRSQKGVIIRTIKWEFVGITIIDPNNVDLFLNGVRPLEPFTQPS